MHMIKTCTIGCLLICAALAQTEDSLKAIIAMVRYAPIAEQARIQGDVRLEASSGVVRHPPRSGWLDELGRLKGGRTMGLGVAHCAP